MLCYKLVFYGLKSSEKGQSLIYVLTALQPVGTSFHVGQSLKTDSWIHVIKKALIKLHLAFIFLVKSLTIFLLNCLKHVSMALETIGAQTPVPLYLACKAACVTSPLTITPRFFNVQSATHCQK